DLGARHAGAVRGDGGGAVAQREERRLGDDGAVDAAAERDDGSFHPAQDFEKVIALSSHVAGRGWVCGGHQAPRQGGGTTDDRPPRRTTQAPDGGFAAAAVSDSSTTRRTSSLSTNNSQSWPSG